MRAVAASNVKELADTIADGSWQIWASVLQTPCSPVLTGTKFHCGQLPLK